METVFIVMSELNGYKRIEDIFSTREGAEAYNDKIKNEYWYDPKKRTSYVCEYNVN